MPRCRTCTVVMHLRPLRCCTRMWMRSFCWLSASASAKGSVPPPGTAPASANGSAARAKGHAKAQGQAA
jgi:hypothetical protein